MPLAQVLAQVFERVPLLSGLPRSVEELPGGLTNRNYKVTTPSGAYVVRVAASDGTLLAIDKDAEHADSIAAAKAGVGAPVHGYLPDAGVIVIGFLPGRTFTEADLLDPVNLARLAEICRRLHAGPRFVRDFDMFEIQRGYLEVVQKRHFRLPAKYLDFMPAVAEIRKCLAVRAEPTVPCHNDLLPGNIVDAGDRLHLIDYEYAGNNDPCFELGNIWSEAHLPPAHLDDLVTAYYGRRLRHKTARARLLGLMSQYGWTLWASIQDAVNETIDFDFWSWGMERYERAAATFTGPELRRVMEAAAGAD